ncbi:MAG TPA: Zn-dependent hydrolase [Candidatus Baltobacteraceae bacterium]|nr:Zn-dependent hydrolase [Candidatus Baltobacteraceae bacterium]
MSESVVARLALLAQIGKHDAGIDRALATPQERRAREQFAQWARAAGYDLRQDRVGNLFARRAGTRDGALPILVGSHLDTVPTGGAYDGAFGVAGALCALELLDQRAISTAHPVEAVAWAGEEGSRFPLGCLGSSGFCGLWEIDALLDLRDEGGMTLREALDDSAGGLLTGVPVRDGHDAAGYLELHVEQGPVLEREGVSLGVVTAIAGQRRYRVDVDGVSGHAGTVPMNIRADALCAAAELVLAVEACARGAEDTVATVGRIFAEPGGTNVIPARATFSLDVRGPVESRIDAVERALHERARNVQTQRGVRVNVERLESRSPAPMNDALRAAVHRAAAALGERAVDIASGAGHDAMCLSQIVPAAMIFVPSVGGRSHVAQERTGERDLDLGVRALAAAIVEVDRIL